MFLAVSAFRQRSVADVADTIRAYCSKHGTSAEPCSPGELAGSDDACWFVPRNGWTTVLWPSFFNIHDEPFCRDASHNLSTLVSTVHVYDGDYWAHFLFEKGRLLDRFCSLPDYFSGEGEPIESESWAGDAELIASRTGADPQVLRRYLVHLDPEASESGKAWADDEFELEDVWVFVDFWRRMGIAYEDPESAVQRLRLDPDHRRRLPVSDQGL